MVLSAFSQQENSSVLTYQTCTVVD